LLLKQPEEIEEDLTDIMAEWWLFNAETQRRIAEHIDDATFRVIDHFDAHFNENSITAALGQELMRESVHFGNTTVIFGYRNFPEQTEEPLIGADGGLLITVTNPRERIEVVKGVLFQAKRFDQDRNPRSLSIPRPEDAGRLKRQILNMLETTKESIVLSYTRDAFYAVDAKALKDLTVEELRYPLATPRLIGFGTYLGKWVARCTRGDNNEVLTQRIREPRGFLKEIIEMNIQTQQRPLLTEGGIPLPFDDPAWRNTPQPNWRKHNS
jgi:hypothetical protein